MINPWFILGLGGIVVGLIMEAAEADDKAAKKVAPAEPKKVTHVEPEKKPAAKKKVKTIEPPTDG